MKIAFLFVMFFSLALRGAVEAVPSLIDLVNDSNAIVAGLCVDTELMDGEISLYILPQKFIKGEIKNTTLIFTTNLRNGESYLDIKRSLHNNTLLLFGTASDHTDKFQIIRMSSQSSLDKTIIKVFPGDQRFIDDIVVNSSLQKTIREIAVSHWNSPSRNTLELLIPLAWNKFEIPLLSSIFIKYMESSDPSLAKTGLDGITILGLPLAVVKTDEIISSQTGSIVDRQLSALEKFYNSENDEALSIIVEWINSDNSLIRATAVGILANIRTPATLPVLAGALFDPDFEVRWRAIGGLSAFANNIPRNGFVPAPGNWIFRTDGTIAHSAFDRRIIGENESRYLNFWRDWWEKNRLAIDKLSN
jgi:hypothetical protein